jgi:hypothetical protein
MSTTTGTATDYVDLLDRLDAFLTATGHAWGKRFVGVGDGDLVEYLGTATSIAETFTLTATSPTSFSVVGSVSGSQGTATVGTTFVGSKITFKLTAGTTAYQAGDVWTINTAQPWQRLQREGYADARSVTTNLATHETLVDGSALSTATATGSTAYIEWVMRHPSTVRRVLLGAYSPAERMPRSFTLQYRDDPGAAWTTAGTFNKTTWAESEAAYMTIATDPGAHRYWRMDMSGGTGAVIIGTLRLLPTLADPSGGIWALDSARWAWQAPGLDGTRQIYVHGSTWWSTSADAYSIRWNVSRGWVADGSWKAGQPGSSGLVYTNLGTTPITYWIVANGQRFILVTAHGGTTQVAYLGLGLPYEPPSVHPYPAICAATSGAAVRYSETDAQQRFPMDPGSQGVSSYASVICYWPSGQWVGGANRYANGGADGSSSTSSNFARVWPAWTGNVSYDFPMYVIDNVGGSRPLIPCVIVMQASAYPAHWWGEYDGLYWTTGFGTTSQATVRHQGFEHLIVNNVFRTQTYHFGAVRLD